jgi:hypothetical protein
MRHFGGVEARDWRMAVIFVSYTSSDREWAEWVGIELEKLGHKVRIHDWEIGAGANIQAWMEEGLQEAEICCCIVSSAYLKAPHSSWERRAAQWAATTQGPSFVHPVFVESCEAPMAMAHIKRCDLHSCAGETEARARLAAYMVPPQKPATARYPGLKASTPVVNAASMFSSVSTILTVVPNQHQSDDPLLGSD